MKVEAKESWLVATTDQGEKYVWFTGTFKNFDRRASKVLAHVNSSGKIRIRASKEGESVIDLGV